MIEWILLLLAIPFGFWLKKAAYDEIKPGQKWFKILLVLGVISGVIFLIIKETALSITSFAISIIAGISLKETFK